jgi:hypothetical protein
MKPIIFSFSTLGDHPGFLKFKRSCKKLGWDMDPRVDSCWPGEREMWGLFWESFPRYRKEGYTHALRMDAWDTIALGTPNELAAALFYYGNPTMLVSAEVGCWPGDYRRDEYPPTPHGWRYAHSPVTVDLQLESGKHKLLPEESFKEYKHTGYGADQKHFADLVIDKRAGVRHDTNCMVVQSLGHAHPWQNHFDIMGHRLQNKHTGSVPLFLHGNGRCDMSWCPEP